MPVPSWVEWFYDRTPLALRRLGYLARTRPGHYYSPYPDLADLDARADTVWKALEQAPGVDLREDAQWELLAELAPLAREVGFADPAAPGARRYRADNRPYVLGDAVVLAAMVGRSRPRRVIEVGSGWSTAALLDAVDVFGTDTAITCVDPHPGRLFEVIGEGGDPRVEVRREPVQQTPFDVFASLGAGDLLVVDSTHVVRAGSDVNHLVFEVFPRLAPGVAVHVHDVFDGFEYPRRWVQERRAWSESYLVRAFLQFNRAFEVTLFTAWLHGRDIERYRRHLPVGTNPGAQLWFTRTGPADGAEGRPSVGQ